MINGILVALIMTGVMATRANLQEINGVSHMSPAEINIIYIQVLFVLVMAGMILDHITSRNDSKKTGI